MPLPNSDLVTGNAYTDGAPRGGWFVAGFIEASLGLRCRRGKQTVARDDCADFELKLKRHEAGDMEKGLQFQYYSVPDNDLVEGN